METVFEQFYCAFWIVLQKTYAFDAGFFIFLFCVNGVKRSRALSSFIWLVASFSWCAFTSSCVYIFLVLLHTFQLLMLIRILRTLNCNTIEIISNLDVLLWVGNDTLFHSIIHYSVAKAINLHYWALFKWYSKGKSKFRLEIS